MGSSVHAKTSQLGVVIAAQQERLVLLSKTISRNEAAKIIRLQKNDRIFASFFPVSEGEAKKVLSVMNQSTSIRNLLS